MGIVKHGQAKRGKLSALYVRWAGMKQRCADKAHAGYKNYGGRGIKIHPAWLDFNVFAKEIPPMPSKRHHLDRINNSKGYVPGNVRWVTQAENNRNSRQCHQVTINGKTQPIFAWLEQNAISRGTYDGRIRRGWSIEEALTVKPLRKRL